jgi:hypothetical protein
MVECPHCNKPVDETLAKSGPVVPLKVSTDDRCPVCNTQLTPQNATAHLAICYPNYELKTTAPTRYGPFADKKCPTCGVVQSPENYHKRGPDKYAKGWQLRYQCKECEKVKHKARSYAWVNRKKETYEDMYVTWKESTRTVPKQNLSEDDWHKACSFFGGCTLCSESHIETREFFQKSTDGGQYSKWNILPMCSKCSTMFRTITNPFLLYTPFKVFGIQVPEDRITKLLMYLVDKLQEATDETTGI